MFRNKKILKNLPYKNNRIVAVDTETTGGPSEDNHILEISAIEIINGHITGRVFHGYIKPRRKINYFAMQVHKIGENFYKENFEGFYESDKKVMENFIEFVGDAYIFAHNADFDAGFINYELKFWKLKQLRSDKYRCSCLIFQSLFRNDYFKSRIKGFSLGKCCEFFKINVNNEGLHSALYDATILAKLICCIYLFLDKNPNYLEKMEVVNLSQFNKVLNKEEFKKQFLLKNNSNKSIKNNKQNIQDKNNLKKNSNLKNNFNISEENKIISRFTNESFYKNPNNIETMKNFEVHNYYINAENIKVYNQNEKIISNINSKFSEHYEQKNSSVPFDDLNTNEKHEDKSKSKINCIIFNKSNQNFKNNIEGNPDKTGSSKLEINKKNNKNQNIIFPKTNNFNKNNNLNKNFYKSNNLVNYNNLTEYSNILDNNPFEITDSEVKILLENSPIYDMGKNEKFKINTLKENINNNINYIEEKSIIDSNKENFNNKIIIDEKIYNRSLRGYNCFINNRNLNNSVFDNFQDKSNNYSKDNFYCDYKKYSENKFYMSLEKNNILKGSLNKNFEENEYNINVINIENICENEKIKNGKSKNCFITNSMKKKKRIKVDDSISLSKQLNELSRGEPLITSLSNLI